MNNEMTDLKAIGKRIKLIREKLGLKQKKLAYETDVAPATLCEVESGNTKPNFDLLFNLSNKFNVNIEFVLNERGSMFHTDHADILSSEGFILKVENTPLMEKFVRYFNSSELVRLYMLASFKEIMIKNKKLIEAETNEGNIKKSKNRDNNEK